mgnify:CR=1 FL=1
MHRKRLLTAADSLTPKINETDIHGNRIMKKSPGYAYIVVPNVSIDGLEESIQNNRGIEILSNTEELQAVKHL